MEFLNTCFGKNCVRTTRTGSVNSIRLYYLHSSQRDFAKIQIHLIRCNRTGSGRPNRIRRFPDSTPFEAGCLVLHGGTLSDASTPWKYICVRKMIVMSWMGKVIDYGS